MRRVVSGGWCAALLAGASIAVSAQASGQAATVLYDGARVIVGDGSTFERGAFLVQSGRITALGRSGDIIAPAGAVRVDLTGSTVMPALINSHAHPGYEGSPANRYAAWRAENWTEGNVLAQLQREAFYGVGVVLSAGSDETRRAMQFAQLQSAGTVAPAATYIYAAGLELPNGGPDPLLMKAAKSLGALPSAATVQEAQSAVQTIAGRNVRHLNIWIDTRGGAYPPMTLETYSVYAAVYEEAHKHQIVVHTRARSLADQKAALRGGTDVLVHVTPDALDEEFLALVREKKPYWIPLDGPGTDPSEWCQDPFVSQGLPEDALSTAYNAATGAAENGCGRGTAGAAAAEEKRAEAFRAMIGAGARVVLGTDAGLGRYMYGWAEHYMLARYVKLGMTPLQAIQAATGRPAELLRLTDRGTLTVGRRADFVVLYANPLDDIQFTRRIANVYAGGAMLPRSTLLGVWNRDLQLARDR